MKYLRIIAALILFCTLLSVFAYHLWSIDWIKIDTMDYSLIDPVAFAGALLISAVFWYMASGESFMTRSKKLYVKAAGFVVSAAAYIFMVLALGALSLVIPYGYCDGQYSANPAAICQARDVLTPTVYGILGFLAFLGLPAFVAGVFLRSTALSSVPSSHQERADVRHGISGYRRRVMIRIARIIGAVLAYIVAWVGVFYAGISLLDACSNTYVHPAGFSRPCQVYMSMYLVVTGVTVLVPPVVSLLLWHGTRTRYREI